MEETKKCPYCGKEIKTVAKKCKHCGKWLDDNATIQQATNIPTNVPQQSKFSNKKIVYMLIAIVSIGIVIFLAIHIGNGGNAPVERSNNSEIETNSSELTLPDEDYELHQDDNFESDEFTIN